MDRRATPTFGYRAIHLIVTEDGKPIEIQVRSYLQHLWAQYSEIISDFEGQEIKYGGGDPRLIQYLINLSEKTRVYETQLLTSNNSTARQAIEEQFNQWLGFS